MQVKENDTRQLLEDAAVDIYGRLLPSLQTPDGEALVMIMANSACIWTGSGFAPAGRIVSKLPEDLYPWIYPVPSCLEPFAALLLRLGVRLCQNAISDCTLRTWLNMMSEKEDQLLTHQNLPKVLRDFSMLDGGDAAHPWALLK